MPREPHETPQLTPRMILGLAVMVVGVLFTLDNLGYLDAGQYLRFWPIVFVLVGIVKLLPPYGRSSGWIWILGGCALLAHQLGRVDISHWWPLLLVALGAQIVWRAATRPRRVGRPRDNVDDAVVSAFAFMSGSKHTSRSQAFRGGELTAIMGGVEVDLRAAAVAESPAVIDVFAFWGGIEIRVPDDWAVVSEGFALMGAFEDETRPAPGEVHTKLVLKGLAIMGGVEVRN